MSEPGLRVSDSVGGRPAPDPHQWDIVSFMTDGAMVALLQELAAISGCAVRLYSRAGRLVEPAHGRTPWTEHDEPALGPRVRTMLDTLSDEETGVVDGWRVVPVRVRGYPGGAIAVLGEGPSHERTVRIATRLASAVGELCDQAVELRERSEELALIFDLSSMLMTTHDVDHVAELALRSAVWILGVDAGTIHLADSEGVLRMKSSMGLSESFSEKLSELPQSRIIDAGALYGETVVIDDVVADGRSMFLEDVKREGIVGLLSTGLVFSEQRLGLMRLYTKRRTVFTGREHDLVRTVAEQVASAVHSAQLLAQRAKARRERRHMKLARDVQQRMLPDVSVGGFPRLDVGARYISSFDVSGDFYDVMPFERSLGFAIGDVVGKGVPAALMMASLRASLRAHAADMYHLDDAIARVNRDLSEYTLLNEFATLFYGVINHDTLRLTYCNAGHEPPYVLRRGAGGGVRLHALDVGGLVVGIDPDASYKRGVFDLAQGDIILSCTDGVTEAMNPAGELFGRERLREEVVAFANEHPEPSAQSLVDHLLWCVRRFVGVEAEGDDITILAVRVRS
ncbi:MAG: GAF domain-containing SpoIIE family protein phosphatase [Planctomycetota bacterium]